MAINFTKVLVGGVAAGVVFTATDIMTHTVLLGDRMTAELEAAAPGVAERLASSHSMVLFIAMNLAVGITLAWLYAAIRPRFGPGMRTAAYAGIFYWIVATIMHSFFVVAGMMSGTTFVIGGAIWLVALLVGAGVAGWLYTEDAPVAAAAPVA